MYAISMLCCYSKKKRDVNKILIGERNPGLKTEWHEDVAQLNIFMRTLLRVLSTYQALENIIR